MIVVLIGDPTRRGLLWIVDQGGRARPLWVDFGKIQIVRLLLHASSSY